MRFIDHRSHLYGGIQAIADFQLPRPCHESLGKFLIDLFVHHNATRRRAALPAGPESTPNRAIHRQVDLGVIHHHDHVLAAHLQAGVLEAPGGILRDLAAHFN